MKKILSVLLAVILVATCLPLAASATTQNDALAWINSYMGKAIDVDGNGAWCVDLTKKYCSDLFGWSPTGNAEAYRTFSLPSGWTRTKYTSGYTPAAGDIVVFDPNASNISSLGHVGIVMSATASSYVSAEQSYNGQKYVAKVNHSSYKSVWGFIRPPFSNTTTPSVSVTVRTGEATNITATGAVINGGVMVKGTTVTSVGIHLGTTKSPLPWVYGSKVTVSSGESYVVITPTSLFQTLTPNTTYYYQLYACYGGQYAYGEVKSFTTAAPPITGTTTTGPATEITDTSAILHGSTVITGGKTTSIGIQMGTSLNNTPQIMGDYLSKESYSWTYAVENLKPNTTYYYRAVSSANGKFFFGEYQTFTTLPAADNIFKLSYYYYSGSAKNGYESKISDSLPCRFIVRSPEEERKGYRFKGWSWNKNSTIPEYQPGDIVEIEENRTLYAVWESDGTIIFEDVAEGEYYYDAVDWAVENKITSGTDDTHFSPNKSCTRAEAVTFLWRAAGSPDPAASGAGFTDVTKGSYYDKAVQWAVEQGITTGTSSGKFSPNATCSRAQIVTFLYRAERSPKVSAGNAFSDVKSGEFYVDAVTWAVEQGITTGTGGGKFSPAASCARGQIVTFLYRYHN